MEARKKQWLAFAQCDTNQDCTWNEEVITDQQRI